MALLSTHIDSHWHQKHLAELSQYSCIDYSRTHCAMAQIDERRLSIREDASSRVLVIYTGGTIGMKKDQKLGIALNCMLISTVLCSLPSFSILVT